MQPNRDNDPNFTEPELPMPGQQRPADDADGERAKQPNEGDGQQEASVADEPTA